MRRAGHDPVPRRGLHAPPRQRAAARARHGRRRRPAQRRPLERRPPYLARSLDGGRTFAPAASSSRANVRRAGVHGPAGRVALVDGPTTHYASTLLPADGSARRRDGAELGGLLERAVQRHRRRGRRRPRRRLRRRDDARLPPAGRRRPEPGGELAAAARAARRASPSSPGGPAASWRCSRRRGASAQACSCSASRATPGRRPSRSARRHQQRLRAHPERARPPDRVRIANDSGDLLPRVHARPPTAACCGPRPSTSATSPSTPTTLEIATNARGAGAAVTNDAFATPSRSWSRASPRAARPSRAAASARRACRCAASATTTSSRSWSRPRAATAASRRAAVLRRARFGRARGARRGFRTRFRARYELRRSRARIPVRVIPRRGKARTLRLRVRRC